uniref:Uncharacterized protein n=1 Tax=Cacopsylla melanoneura TaxID=428564 RepID=A0A8D8PKL6_9HEMI
MWSRVKRKFNCNKYTEKAENNALNFDPTSMTDEIHNISSLKELSDLIKSVYERQTTYLDDTLPNHPECPRCTLYQNSITDVYQQSDYFISIIEEFEALREEENKKCDNQGNFTGFPVRGK